MRIAITGAHGTAKTKLAKILSNRLSLPYITGQAPPAKSNIIKDKKLARDFQVLSLISQLNLEDYHASGFISDRAALNYLAYWNFYNLDDDLFGELYKNFCLNRNYDYLIYVPIESSQNYTSKKLRRAVKVDSILREILKQTEIPIIKVVGSTKRKVSTIINNIDRGIIVAGTHKAIRR